MADGDKHLEPSRWQEFLEHQFIMNTERDAVELDKILEQEKKHASDGAWHHRPKDSRARYNVLAFATFCFFILFLSGFIVACVTLANTPLKGEKFRISLLQLSNGSVPGPFFNLSAVLLDAGMSDSGCTTAVAGMKNVGANVEVTYESTVHPDAWHLELAPDFEWQEHSMEFEVAVLRNDGTVRQTVLHPVQCGWGTSKRWTVNQQGNNWDGRRTTLELPEVWWESVFGILVEFAFGAVGCAIASILAMRNEARLAWRTLRVMTAGILATVLILALAETISEGWRHSFYWWRAVYGSSVLLFFLAPDARSMFDAALMLVRGPRPATVSPLICVIKLGLTDLGDQAGHDVALADDLGLAGPGWTWGRAAARDRFLCPVQLRPRVRLAAPTDPHPLPLHRR